jgi:hypothetical protein
MGGNEMKEGPLDPRIDKLVALLYGELPDEEAVRVRAMINADPDLSREWDELTETREMIGEWKLEEAEGPGFVFVDDVPRAQARRRASGWIERIRSIAFMTPWAITATAVLVAAFAIGGAFHVERKGGSIAFRFGRPPVTEILAAQNASIPNMQEAVPLGGTPVSAVVATDRGIAGTKPDGIAPYLTKQEFEAYSAGMMQTLVVLLNEYGKQHDKEIGAFLQTAITQVADRQTRDYGDLRNRIEALGVGVGNLDYRLQKGEQASEPAATEGEPSGEMKGEGK